MKIIITGMPYFAQKLYQQLSEFDKINTYIYLDTFYKKIDKLQYLLHILNSDVVYMIGGSVCCSNVISISLKLNKRVVLHWAGTDILEAKKLIKQNNYNKRYIDNITHLCETTWIQEELKSIGIYATVKAMIVYEQTVNINNLIVPQTLKVLSYIGKDRPEFYGIDTIIQLANDFKNIEFRVAGLEKYDNIPSNITLLGWTNMDNEYEKCLIYIRTPKHDGLAFSVIEALSYGRVVFYNYDFNHVNYFENYNDLKGKFQNLLNQFQQDGISINDNAINYVKKEFKKEKVLSNLIKTFKS